MSGLHAIVGQFCQACVAWYGELNETTGSDQSRLAPLALKRCTQCTKEIISDFERVIRIHSVGLKSVCIASREAS